MFYDAIVKPFLFKMDPEQAHHLAVRCINNPLLQTFYSLQGRVSKKDLEMLGTDLCGIPLPTPVGLAAGFDKNAEMYPHLHNFGFSFVEVGTVTAKAQDGNPTPRLFRLPRDKALINRMGFNNHGVDDAAKRLTARRSAVPLGGNIGKSKVTPLEEAVSDYEYSFNKLKPLVDYFVVNVSSPNTPNLRKLQDKEPLNELLSHLASLNKDPKLPLLLKIAPDLTESQLEDIVEVVTQNKLDGVIATNTTISRANLKTEAARIEEIGAGGLSGMPLRTKSTAVIRYLRRNLPAEVQVIGVGGIFYGIDAYSKIISGASSLQIYTGFVYRGPNSVYKILSELADILRRDGFKNLKEAIGSGL